MAITFTKSREMPRSKFAGYGAEDAEWEEERGVEDPSTFQRSATLLPPDALTPDDRALLTKGRAVLVPIASLVMVLHPRSPEWARWAGAAMGIYSLVHTARTKKTAVQGYSDCGCGCNGAGTCR